MKTLFHICPQIKPVRLKLPFIRETKLHPPSLHFIAANASFQGHFLRSHPPTPHHILVSVHTPCIRLHVITLSLFLNPTATSLALSCWSECDFHLWQSPLSQLPLKEKVLTLALLTLALQDLSYSIVPPTPPGDSLVSATCHALAPTETSSVIRLSQVHLHLSPFYTRPWCHILAANFLASFLSDCSCGQ